jgi:flagellar protein FlbD
VIILTRLGVGLPLAVNPDLIERAESTPDTVITLVDGSKLVVVETLDEVMGRVRTWRAAVIAEAYLMALQPPPASGGTPTPDGAAEEPESHRGRPRLQLAAPPADTGRDEPDERRPTDLSGRPQDRATSPVEDLDALAAQSTLAGLARALRLPRKG